MLFKYIAGRNIHSVIKVAKKIREKNKIPVFNYAVESSNNSLSTFKEFEKLANYIHKNDKVAIKLSSFNFDKCMINDLVDIFKSKEIKIIIDAESNSLQKQYIDTVNNLILNHNKNDVNIIKTYQMYRKDSMITLQNDMNNFEDIFHGTKIVRGAYWNNEYKEGHIFTNKFDTDMNYDNSLKYLSNYAKNKSLNIVATHNTESIDLGQNLNKYHRVFEFGHLYGMKEKKYKNLVSDSETVNVYLPYGPYNLMFPYLFRRFYENLDTIKYMI